MDEFEFTGFQRAVMQGVGAGLTNIEITDMYGGSGVHNEVSKILSKLGLQSRTQLMFYVLACTEHAVDDEALIEAAEQVLKLNRYQRLVLAVLLRVCLAHMTDDLGELRHQLKSIEAELRSKRNRTTFDEEVLNALGNALGFEGLLAFCKKALRQLELPARPMSHWQKLVRYYYLALVFDMTHPDPGEA